MRSLWVIVGAPWYKAAGVGDVAFEWSRVRAAERSWIMPYIARGNSGAIIAVFKEENECAREHVRPENRELQAFLGQNRLADKARERTSGRSKLHQALRQSDADFVRVLDDLISLLLNKGTIVFTDLPTEARQKLMVRRRLRDRARDLGGLIGEAEEIRLS